MTALEYINLIDYDAWVDHSNPRSHKSKKCFTCFNGSGTYSQKRYEQNFNQAKKYKTKFGKELWITNF